MCGRIAQYKEFQAYARALGARFAGPIPNAPPRYNGAPSQELLVARKDPKSGERQLHLIRWGLIPHWADDPKIAWKLINARGESVGSTRAFRDAYRQRRCLVPVDGFYEWRTIGNSKQPYMIQTRDGEPFALGGLWENWNDPKTGEWTRTFTIVTTEANALVAQLHDRMPVIIAPEDQERWLNPGEDPRELIRPYPATLMTMFPVSTKLNPLKNEGADLIQRTEVPADLNGSDEPMERVNEQPSRPANSE